MKKSLKTLLLTITLGLSPVLMAMDQSIPAAPELDQDYIPGAEQLTQADLEDKEFAAQVESKRKSHQKQKQNGVSADKVTEQSFATPVNETDIEILAKLGLSACSGIICNYVHGWNPVKVFKGHDAPVTHLFDDHSQECVLPFRDYFMTTDDTGRINVWHPDKTEPLFTHNLNFNNPVAVINAKPLWSHAGSAYVAVVFKNMPTYLYVYRIQNKNNAWSVTLLPLFEGHEQPISEIDFSIDEKDRISIETLSHNDKNFRIWNINTGMCEFTSLGERDELQPSYPFHHCGCPHSCTDYVGNGNNIHIKKPTDEEDDQLELETKKILAGHTADITDLCCYHANFKYKTDKHFIITASKDCTVKIWNPKACEGQECVQTLTGPQKPVTRCLILDHKDKTDHLLAASADGCVYMWELIDGNELMATNPSRGITPAPKKKKNEAQEEVDGSVLASIFAESEPQKKDQDQCSIQ